MRKVIYECVNNSILYAVAGPFFIFMATGPRSMAGVALLMFTIYAIFYYIARFVFLKKSKSSLANYFRCNEIAKDDEREVQITGKALRTAYYVAIYSMLIIMLVLFIVKVAISQVAILFVAAMLLISLALVVTTCAYCIRWVVEYKK